MSPDRTILPLTLSVMISGTPPTRVETHGRPEDIASSKDIGSPSLAELSTNHVHLLRSDIVGRDDKNVLVVGNEAFQLSREGLLACTPSV